MKVYKRENDILIQNKDKFYCLDDKNWDKFINDDQLYLKILASISNTKKINIGQFDKFSPPIDSQELWASGVTYYMSKKEERRNLKKLEVLYFTLKYTMQNGQSYFLRPIKIEFLALVNQLE